jgi:hypothetical protein
VRSEKAKLKSCGKTNCRIRKPAERIKTILNQIVPGLLRMSIARQNMMNGLSQIMLRFHFICK